MEIKHKKIATAGVVLATFGIILGAFGAHGLESILSPEKIASFEVGVRYQLYHALALLFLSLVNLGSIKATQQVYLFMLVGTLLFSGSIYLLSFTTAWNFNPGMTVLITPLGGGLLIAGWVRLFLAIAKLR